MRSTANLSPKFRPPTPSLNRGPIQVRARRAFIGSGLEVMSTPEIAAWVYVRKPPQRYAHLRRVLARYAERVGRDYGWGRPWLWKLKPDVLGPSMGPTRASDEGID
jgi:hypothetical protein